MPTVDERLIVECSYRVLAALLESMSDVWIGPFATIASEQAEWSKQSPGGRGDRSVTASASPDAATRPVVGGSAVGVVWTTSGYRSVFPSFIGELSVRAVDDRMTELRLAGEYARPRGWDASVVACRRLMAHLRTAVEELARETARPPLARLASAGA